MELTERADPAKMRPTDCGSRQGSPLRAACANRSEMEVSAMRRCCLVLTVALLVSSLQSCDALPRTTGTPSSETAAPPPAAVRTPSPSPTPSPTIPAPQMPEPSPACPAPEIEAYLGAVSPLLDQLVLASREATQLQNLPSERVAALVRSARDIQGQLSDIQPPQCLQDAHLAALQATARLGEALEHMTAGAYPSAEAALRASFEQSALAIALIAMQYGQRAPTPTVTP